MLADLRWTSWVTSCHLIWFFIGLFLGLLPINIIIWSSHVIGPCPGPTHLQVYGTEECSCQFANTVLLSWLTNDSTSWNMPMFPMSSLHVTASLVLWFPLYEESESSSTTYICILTTMKFFLVFYCHMQ